MTPEEAQLADKLALINPDLISDEFREAHLRAAHHATLLRQVAERRQAAEEAIASVLQSDKPDLSETSAATWWLVELAALDQLERRLPPAPDFAEQTTSAITHARVTLAQAGRVRLELAALAYAGEVRRWEQLPPAARANTPAPIRSEMEARADQKIDPGRQALARFDTAAAAWVADSESIPALDALASVTGLLAQLERTAELVADANEAVAAANAHRREAGLTWRPPKS